MGSFLPTGPTSIKNVTPAYVYQEYADDDNIQGMVAGFNAYAQAYLDWFNALDLPIYTGLSGSLLDWVATNLYGFPRPVLPITGRPARGPWNTAPWNTLAYDQFAPAAGWGVYATSDDIYKRCLTWLYYKGDSHQINIRWVKRRVARFLYGVNGTDYTGDTYAISLVFTGKYAATITVPTGGVSLIFQAAVNAGILELPFQIVWTVVVG